MPGFGYGIDYEYGLFKQQIVNGYQHEKPDRWKTSGTPFYIERANEAVIVPMYGTSVDVSSSKGTHRGSWQGARMVIGIPRVLPVAGYGGHTTNTLSLFSALASEDFDIDIFNRGDYILAIDQKIASENISRVLYPSDSGKAGKELRLVQEYFMVACALKDIMRHFLHEHNDFDQLPSKVAIQMNDTHPALSVAELMRLLVDEHGVEWERAWKITQATCAYTNHTLLPEALERWPLEMMEHVVPRHLHIIYSINEELLKKVVSSFPGDLAKESRMSLIEEGNGFKQVRMANLAIVGSHSVNGVSALHSELVKTTLVPDFAEMWPERFNNKTNGVAHRRWVLKANPGLAKLLTRTIGKDWITEYTALANFEQHIDDPGVAVEFSAVKHRNKVKLAALMGKLVGIHTDPDSIFDVQVKRIHEYKRQLLNVLRIIHDYHHIVEDGGEPLPRTYIFGGKAAPGYWAAKQIIKLIHNVGKIVNGDPRCRDLIKVVFVPDYRVSLAEAIMPAADLSEQISTASTEASGTGNMKFAMNGAITVGTLDGANVEIANYVGKENIYIFGLETPEVLRRSLEHSYHPREFYDGDDRIRRVMDALANDIFSPGEPGLFRGIYDSLMADGERYFHLADLGSYIDAQEQIDRDYRNHDAWVRKAMLNTARTGVFSSDRTIGEYAREIWDLKPVDPIAQPATAAAH
jgi:glycogen phosphorylase